MISVAVLIPVLRRPHRVEPLLASLRASEHRVGPRANPVFICSPGDKGEIAAVRAAGLEPLVANWKPEEGGDWAKKNALAFRETKDEFVLLGADDLHFHPGWMEAAISCHLRTHACVVGTNDLGNASVIAGHHSTHPLVHRAYGECGTVDDPSALIHGGYFHNFCNPPSAPILMADATFRPLGEVEVGDVVVGWERIEAEAARVGTPRRALCYSRVLNVQTRTAPLVRVIMESGRELQCTPDHRWLNAKWSPRAGHDAQFVTPRIGRTFLHVAEQPAPLPAELQRVAGWLAGIYDGEGSGIYIATQSTTANPDIVSAISGALAQLDIPHSMTIRQSGVAEFVLIGGRQGYLNFLTRIDPVRRTGLAARVLGWRTYSSSRREHAPIGARRFGHQDKVIGVENAADSAEVISLTTASGNYIAWGYCSRNCDTEFVQTAKARGTWAFAVDARVEHLHPNWKKGRNDEVYALAQARFLEDRRIYRSRERLWAVLAGA